MIFQVGAYTVRVDPSDSLFDEGMTMNTTMKKLALLMGVLATSGTVMAATQDLTVKAVVAPSCIFGAPATLDFGTLSISDLAAGKVDTGAAAVKITCTLGAVPARLYGGATRAMSNGVDSLAYEVYTDNTRLVPLESTNSALAAIVPATGTEQTVNLYGKTAASQGTKPSGSYSQRLLLTVEF